MTASLHRLQAAPTRLRKAQAAALRQMVLDFPGLPPRAVGAIVSSIDRATAAENGWTFVQLSPEQNRKVIAYLLESSSRPQQAVLLWATLFNYIRRDTQEITLTRDEIAERVGVDPDTVSRIMGELVRFGAITRRRERIVGMRGPGAVRYFMNPTVATYSTGKTRDCIQAAAPQLKIVEPA